MNHYETLNLRQNCSAEDIKKAYKTFSLKYHPDNQDTGDTQKFLKIKESYDFLIKNHGNNPKSAIDRLFSQMFKPEIRKQHVILFPLTIEEAMAGVTKELNIILDRPCPKCTPITRSTCLNCKGWGYQKESKKGTFKFDQITQQNQTHRYKNFYKDIDLIIKTHIKNTEDFQLKDKRVYSRINLNIFKAILGGEMKVKTLEGYESIHLPPNNIANFNYLLKGKGFKGGDHIAKFNIFLPKELTDNQKKLLNCIINEEKIET